MTGAPTAVSYSHSVRTAIEEEELEAGDMIVFYIAARPSHGRCGQRAYARITAGFFDKPLKLYPPLENEHS